MKFEFRFISNRGSTMRRKAQQNTVKFRLKPVASAVMLSLAVQVVYAGPGKGVTTYPDGRLADTYYAHSPSGMRPDPALLIANGGVWDKGANPGIDTGKALRKFVDPLPGLCPSGPHLTVGRDANNKVINKCIPIAVADTTKYPGSDYYEIAVVEYEEIMHSDLPKATRLRGYVQMNDQNNPVTFNADGTANGARYLGPVISATRGRPVRIKFVNLLPAGQAVSSVNPTTGEVTYLGNMNGNGGRKGDLFLPVDRTLMGAGLGPDGATMFLQNRAELHLHGGDTPWISDGTPHQWIVPAKDENALKLAGKTEFARGASTQNVPDMEDPGSGAVTYYFPNNQSARLMFYHDHSAGLTRLNVYAGEAAGYLISDTAEAALINGGTITGIDGVQRTIQAAIPPANATIPLVIQEKTFVPKDIALQDAKWNENAWGKPGDLWFPHVYETNQDPLSGDGTNPVGRWDWGPYFWPVFPSLYNLPTGVYGDVTTTPEAFLDTPIVNGQAYPFLNVEPKAYRFRILNATNDRFLNLGLYVADPAQCAVDAPVSGPGGGVPPRCNTEVKMVPFNTNAATFPTDTALNPGIMGTGWGQPDGRAGGVPDPATVGPNIIQIGTEGGFLPSPVDIPSTPVNYEYNRRSITVLGIFEHGLLMGAAERADVVIDFSQYAGKTLIVYNDAPAPVPAFDPRIDFHVDAQATTDDYLAGGAMPSQVGFGPNTRTIMQINVGTTVTTPSTFNLETLKTELPKAFAASQEKPIVPQMAYNAAWQGIATTDQFAKISTGTLQQPTFDFVSAVSPDVVGGVELKKDVAGLPLGGSGYITPPAVTISDAVGSPGKGAKASATLRINKISVTNPGSGYLTVPLVTIGTLPDANNVIAPGSGATGVAFLKIVGANRNSRGSRYSDATTTVTIGAPDGWARYAADRPDLGIVRATAKAVVEPATIVVRGRVVPNPDAGRITGLLITNPGAGYTVLPTVTIASTSGGSGASFTLDAGIERIDLQSPTPGRPDLAGGRGYTDMTLVSINLRGGAAGGTVANPATAEATGAVAELSLSAGGSGYVTPTLTVPAPVMPAGYTLPAGVTAVAAQGQFAAAGVSKMAIHNKAIQELFEPNYGRMNATLGIEMPFTSALIQTTIPLAYIDPATESLKDGETQIWKITHNGVDTHPVHFHLANLQLVNRVGWDGTIKPPKPNELGWKETIQMNPLEDIVVAVRAKRPSTKGVTGKNGFGLPQSVRLMDPTQPRYAMTGFTQVDAKTGNPAIVYNDVANYNWEYVWHCHILGHEENDFMRPMVFDPLDGAPAAASGLSLAGKVLSWTDNAETEYKYEIFTQGSSNPNAAKTVIATTLANASSFTITTRVNAGQYLGVRAVGVAGSVASPVIKVNKGIN
jgi:FtsP/CotA-like multicopper oxidase with cupredoxin domain